MKTKHLFHITVLFLVTALSACDVEKTREGSLPSVDVNYKEGQLPEYDIDTADINIDTKEVVVEVPDVEVSTKKKTITVPDLSIEMPDDK